MISYAQNFEDVILSRLFDGKPRGFYIDIGAWEPTLDSVTKHFYDVGWSGINVEPMRASYEALVKERPRDINLQIGVDIKTGKQTVFEIPETGLTTFDAAIADAHKQTGLPCVVTEIEMLTLAQVCEKYVQCDIDFLKIDVEGYEGNVIASGDWKKFRPKVLVVEATYPRSQIPNFEQWEPLLIAADYQFAYFDGLNRFYVAAEHGELLKHFNRPPNFFDDFELAKQVNLQKALDTLFMDTDKRLTEANESLTEVSKNLWDANQRIAFLDGQLTACHQSWRWRATAPIHSVLKKIYRAYQKCR